METVGEFLTRWRKRRSMSQTEAAEKVDLSRTTVARWEAGKAKPTFDGFVSLLAVYDVPSDEWAHVRTLVKPRGES